MKYKKRNTKEKIIKEKRQKKTIKTKKHRK